jgi:hypothetical protein
MYSRTWWQNNHRTINNSNIPKALVKQRDQLKSLVVQYLTS